MTASVPSEPAVIVKLLEAEMSEAGQRIAGLISTSHESAKLARALRLLDREEPAHQTSRKRIGVLERLVSIGAAQVTNRGPGPGSEKYGDYEEVRLTPEGRVAKQILFPPA